MILLNASIEGALSRVYVFALRLNAVGDAAEKSYIVD